MPFGGAGHLADQIFHAPEAKSWHFAAELCTLSGTDSLRDSVPTDLSDNLSEICPLKLTDFCLFLYHIHNTQSYKGRVYPEWLSKVVMTRA